MAHTIDVRPIVVEQLQKLKAALNQPGQLLAMIGALVVNDCRRAFHRQALGDIQWQERYPGMASPKINIAGALADFISGRPSPKPNRFQDRPALIGEGMRGGLQASVTYRVAGKDTVMVGSNKPYASLQQEGGTSEQTYGEDVKKRIETWLFKQRRRPGPRGGRFEPRRNREGYVKHLAPLLHKNVHRQRVIARPFIGVTDNAERQIRMAVQRFFVEAQK